MAFLSTLAPKLKRIKPFFSCLSFILALNFQEMSLKTIKSGRIVNEQKCELNLFSFQQEG